jgi:hypothetical protein
MSRSSRVQDIARSLTSKQTAKNYVTQLQRFDSFVDYCASANDPGRIVPRLAELAAQIEDAIEDALSEADDRELAKAVKAGIEEVAFLVFLHQHVIGLIAQEERVLVLLAQLAEEQLKLAISLSARRLVPGSDDALILRTRWESFGATTELLVTQFYSLSETVKYLENRYFDGLSILFKSSRILLEQIEEQLEGVIKLSDMLAPRGDHDVPIVDLKNWRDVAHRKSEQTSSDLIDMAKADAMSYLGDSSGARRATCRISDRLRSGGNKSL